MKLAQIQGPHLHGSNGRFHLACCRLVRCQGNRMYLYIRKGCLVLSLRGFISNVRFFNKMAGVPKRVENFLKEGFGDTRHLSINIYHEGLLFHLIGLDLVFHAFPRSIFLDITQLLLSQVPDVLCIFWLSQRHFNLSVWETGAVFLTYIE